MNRALIELHLPLYIHGIGGLIPLYNCSLSNQSMALQTSPGQFEKKLEYDYHFLSNLARIYENKKKFFIQ